MLIIIIITVVVLLLLFVMLTYNRLVRFRNNRENAFADIDVQLNLRHDLIPQLVDTVKGYMKHENETLVKLTQARSAAISAENINQKIDAENQLSAALGGLKVSVEAYPELKASTNFMQLQEEMADIENKLAAVRRYFNSTTREYNNAVETFPANLVAKILGFKREKMFEVNEQQRMPSDTTFK